MVCRLPKPSRLAVLLVVVVQGCEEGGRLAAGDLHRRENRTAPPLHGPDGVASIQGAGDRDPRRSPNAPRGKSSDNRIPVYQLFIYKKISGLFYDR